MVPKLSIRVNIDEVLPITEVKVPAIRNNDIQDSTATGIINYSLFQFDQCSNFKYFSYIENDLAVITRTNKTSVSVLFEPTEAQQKNSSKDGLQGQFVIQYDVDRSSLDRKGGEIHVKFLLNIKGLSILTNI